jgi:hypothetical protein
MENQTSLNPDRRPLPDGWVQEYDSAYVTSFCFVVSQLANAKLLEIRSGMLSYSQAGRLGYNVATRAGITFNLPRHRPLCPLPIHPI